MKSECEKEGEGEGECEGGGKDEIEGEEKGEGEETGEGVKLKVLVKGLGQNLHHFVHQCYLKATDRRCHGNG